MSAVERERLREKLALAVRHHAREAVAAQRRHADGAVRVHAVARPGGILVPFEALAVAAQTGVVEPEALVLDHADAADAGEVAGVPLAGTPATRRDVGVRARLERLAVAREREVQGRLLGEADLLAVAVVTGRVVEDLHHAEHEGLVGDGVETVELPPHAVCDNQPSLGAWQSVEFVGLLVAPAPAAVLAAERARGEVAARTHRPAVAQREHPHAPERIVVGGGTVAGNSRAPQGREVDAVLGCPEPVVRARRNMRLGDVELPVGVRVRRRVVGRHVPAVERVVLEEAVRAGHDAEVGVFPFHAVGGFRVADVAEPVGLVPETELPPRGVPPEAAVGGGGEVHGLVAFLRAARSVGHARGGAAAGPHHGVVLLHGTVPVADESAGRLHEVVVDEQLASDADVDRGGARAERGRRQGQGNADALHSRGLLSAPIIPQGRVWYCCQCGSVANFQCCQ